MTPEQLVDETYEKFGEYFETIPEQLHERMLVGIFAKRITDQQLFIEYLKSRLLSFEKGCHCDEKSY